MTSLLLTSGTLIIHTLTLTHIPHPIQSVSDMKAILSAGVTSIHSFPVDARRDERISDENDEVTNH